jgi:hypothetical protein
MRQRLDQFYVRSHFIDNLIDLADFEKPIKPRIKTYLRGAGYDDRKRSFIQFQKGLINSDGGFLLESPTQYEFFQQVNVRQDTLKNEFMYILSYEVLQNSQEIARAYKKIPEVLASIGGIFKLFTVTGQAILYFYSKFSLLNDVANKLYEMKETEIELSSQSQVQNFVGSNINLDKDKIPKNVPVKLNWKHHIKHLICGTRFRNPTEKCHENIVEKMEMCNYLKMALKIDLVVKFLELNQQPGNFMRRINLDEI